MRRLCKHSEHHLVGRIGWMRAAVLGANDGIISTASLIPPFMKDPQNRLEAEQPRGAAVKWEPYGLLFVFGLERKKLGYRSLWRSFHPLALSRNARPKYLEAFVDKAHQLGICRGVFRTDPKLGVCPRAGANWPAAPGADWFKPSFDSTRACMASSLMTTSILRMAVAMSS